MVPGPFHRLVAAALVATLAALLPAPVWSGVSASWSGRVLDADRSAPRPSVVVGLLDEHGAWSARSQPTRADGAFAIENAAPGTYHLAVEAPEGVFLLADPVELHAGSNVPTAVTLHGGTQSSEQGQGFGKSAHDMRPWVKWAIAGSIGVAALFALAEVSKNESEPAASPTD